MPQRLALKYNTTPPPPCQHFLTDFFIFFAFNPKQQQTAGKTAPQLHCSCGGYEKTGCIWVPSIAHGAFNAVAALFVVLTNPADAYYNVLGPMPIGLIGMLPMLAAAVWLTLREMKQEEKS